ncbi:hypothetical protein Rhe02_91620 [Rhizocola hellebori]|uniref:Nitroreductase family deazaflavin-dependent oxidoreductase n=1 Tax=Rhizocola hellebori TaxID=1392758 RepID=A0A8J3VLR1_9ACTN|nr:nitroreductase family deazaflavin-dependent oxidoreductase [Rhizocola hellebori]GIH11095.1 hypothetical protein Rhe02_91620 [Rhizocola hellebori]
MARRAPSWLKWVNPINRFLLGRGIGPAPQHLLTTIGRRSGKPRTTPVAVLTVDGERYLVAGYDGSDWVKNARAAGNATLRRGRKLEDVALVEVPIAQRAAILRHFAQSVRGGQSFLTVAPDAPTLAFEDAAPRHPIFHIIRSEPNEVTTDATDHA